MKERGKKGVDSSSSSQRNCDVLSDFYLSSSSDLQCKKHPSVSSVGICPHCLNDRLVNLVCSECGEQRLSSCSCSHSLPNNNNCSTAAVEAGRISSLLENEKSNGSEAPKQPEKEQKSDEFVIFKRSNSSCVEIKKKNRGIWRIGRFFKKAGTKNGRDLGDEKNDSRVLVDTEMKLGVSRSRSLCSFRGYGLLVGSEDGSSNSRSSISAARSSSVYGGLGFCETEPRRSCFEGRKSNFSEAEHRKSNYSETEQRRACFESRKSNFSETEFGRKSNFSDSEPRRSCFEGRRSNFSETEPRRSDFNRRVSSLKESYFTGGEEPGFIDLKFDLLSSSDQKQDYPYFGSMRSCGNDDFMPKDGVLDHGGRSCRVTVNVKGIEKRRKSFKGWKWIFRHQPAKKKDGEDTIVH